MRLEAPPGLRDGRSVADGRRAGAEAGAQLPSWAQRASSGLGRCCSLGRCCLRPAVARQPSLAEQRPSFAGRQQAFLRSRGLLRKQARSRSWRGSGGLSRSRRSSHSWRSSGLLRSGAAAFLAGSSGLLSQAGAAALGGAAAFFVAGGAPSSQQAAAFLAERRPSSQQARSLLGGAAPFLAAGAASLLAERRPSPQQGAAAFLAAAASSQRAQQAFWRERRPSSQAARKAAFFAGAAAFLAGAAAAFLAGAAFAVAVVFWPLQPCGAAASWPWSLVGGALVEAVFFAVAIIFSFVDLHKTLRGTRLRSDSMRCGVTHRNDTRRSTPQHRKCASGLILDDACLKEVTFLLQIDHLAHPGERVFLVGEQGLKADLRGAAVGDVAQDSLDIRCCSAEHADAALVSSAYLLQLHGLHEQRRLSWSDQVDAEVAVHGLVAQDVLVLLGGAGHLVLAAQRQDLREAHVEEQALHQAGENDQRLEQGLVGLEGAGLERRVHDRLDEGDQEFVLVADGGDFEIGVEDLAFVQAQRLHDVLVGVGVMSLLELAQAGTGGTRAPV
ncbi:hypothetical protein FQR65_LT20177 [Abscondita terminalis]|nr:hypothetical protein FQR65_LT20177 [Abscondita terminalis]